jgi:hypothetical protein
MGSVISNGTRSYLTVTDEHVSQEMQLLGSANDIATGTDSIHGYEYINNDIS